MRVGAAVLILAAALPFGAIAGEGDYCAIPKLVQGVPTVVDVPYIDKPFCGMALIDRHYVRLSEITKSQDETPVSCSAEGACTKTTRYYTDEMRESQPYIIIFQGPKYPRPA